jgi:uncharacterized RDD family membrane protein YckC
VGVGSLLGDLERDEKGETVVNGNEPPPGRYGGQQQYPEGGQQGQYGGQPPPGQYGEPPPEQYPQPPPGQYPQPPPGRYGQPPPGQYPQQTYQAAGPSGPRANFGQRLGAYLLDALIVGIPLSIISSLLGASLFRFNFSVNEATGEVNGGDVGAAAGTALLIQLLSVIVAAVYFAFFEGGASGQTLGKKALGIRVIRQEDGQPLGYGRAVGRYFARFLSSICLLGYLWMLWDKEKQTWHDKLTSTVVVPTAAYPIP